MIHRITLYGLLALGLVLAGGWAKAYIEGAALSPYQALYAPRPKPHVAPLIKEVVKWRTVTKTVPVKVYVQSAKQAEKFNEEFALNVGKPGGPDLLSAVKLEPLPYGGEAAVTRRPTGEVDVQVAPKRRPFFELGGVREAGAWWDVRGRTVTAYYQQDLLRVGPVIGRGFVQHGAGGFSYGVGVAVRF